MKYLALDYGEKRIGTAVSDEGGTIAFPNRVIDATKAVRKPLEEIVASNGIGAIVVGMPLDREGNEGIAATGARRFSEKLAQWFGIPVVLWDERMTTAQAHRVMQDHRKGNADLAAATLILQSYLDSL
jgi:putative holliday junction resolvase